MDKKWKTLKSDETERNELKFVIATLRELIKNSAFSKQRKSLEDIQKIIEKSFENERKLNTKCLRQQSEIAANTSKIKAAIQLSEEDKNTIDTLQEELEKAWKIAADLRSERSKSKQACSPVCEERSNPKDLLQNNALIQSLQRKISNFDEAEKMWASEKQVLQNDLDIRTKQSENFKVEVQQLQQQINNMNSIVSAKDKTIKQLETDVKFIEELNKRKELGRGDPDVSLTEIESNKLQIFELEEEIFNQEKSIEELTNENRLKTARLEELEREITTLKKSNELLTEKKYSDLLQMERINKEQENKCMEKSHKNIGRLLDKSVKKENEISIKLQLLELNLEEKINLLFSTQNDNRILRSTLHEKTELCKLLKGKCHALEEEIHKILITVKELENLRNKHVSVMGRLENENYKLTKDLAIYENQKYPEKIKCLENELLLAKENIERTNNSLNDCNQEMDKLRIIFAECRSLLKDSLQIIGSVHSNYETNNKTGLEFNPDNLISNPKHHNIQIFALTLKEKIKNLAEYCKELMVDKYKLLDEVEHHKSSRNSTMIEKETKSTETDAT
ncbi:uncharacterized protein NPIL_647401, partial [Nephila pilipes]